MLRSGCQLTYLLVCIIVCLSIGMCVAWSEHWNFCFEVRGVLANKLFSFSSPDSRRLGALQFSLTAVQQRCCLKLQQNLQHFEHMPFIIISDLGIVYLNLILQFLIKYTFTWISVITFLFLHWFTVLLWKDMIFSWSPGNTLLSNRCVCS